MKPYTTVKVVSKKNTHIFHLHSFRWPTANAWGKKQNKFKPEKNPLGTVFLYGNNREATNLQIHFKFPCPFYTQERVAAEQMAIREMKLSANWV